MRKNTTPTAEDRQITVWIWPTERIETRNGDMLGKDWLRSELVRYKRRRRHVEIISHASGCQALAHSSLTIQNGKTYYAANHQG